MKCLEKDRNRRYETASAFAADIQRYLHDEPVAGLPAIGLVPVPQIRPAAQSGISSQGQRLQSRCRCVGSLIGGVLVLAASNAQVHQEQKQTQQALEREQETSYIQRIALAERELAAGNVGRAEELLDECPLDRRGWEWHFLKRQRYGNPPPMKHTATVVRAAFSPDGRQIATACMDGTIDNSGRTDPARSCTHWSHRRYLLGEALPRGMTYSLDGRNLAVARNDGKIRVWDSSSGQLLHTLEAHKGPAWQVAFSPDGRTLASGGSDRTCAPVGHHQRTSAPSVFLTSVGGQGRGVPSRWSVGVGGL